jgi:DNA polymerase
MILSIDFETASHVDLFKLGVYHYAQDPSTRVLMMGWALDEEPVEVWTPDQPFPTRVIDHVRQGGEIRAWNAQFERLIWWYVLGPDLGLPEPTLEQFRCSAARARAHGMPGALKDCGKLLDLPIQKQEAGQRLIKTYCTPGHKIEIPPEDLALFIEYCRRDVEVERLICTVLRDLTEYEWHDYWVNERINDRGVPVDTQFARAAQVYGTAVKAEVNASLRALTFGAVANARERSTRNQWLQEHLTLSQLEAITENGVLRFSQPHRDILLARDDLTSEARTFTELVNEAGGATLQKYQSFAERAVEGRLHGAFLFSGGGQTGRYSSIGIQLHNLRRDVFENPQEVIDKIFTGEPIENPAKALSRLIRSAIWDAQGLVWIDYSNIEGRVAPWLEGSIWGGKKVQLFRDGVDPYIFNASQTFHVPMDQVTKQQRQAGKVQELALQFGGGVGALQHMGGAYGLEITEEYGRTLRDAWRTANPWMQSFSSALETAALSAYHSPGSWYDAGRISYAYDGTDWLWCRLPSGRLLAYLHPRLEDLETPWGRKTALTVVWGGSRPKVGEPWPRRALHGGLQIENCTQAVAADLLRDALSECDHHGIEVVGHVHDEIIAQNTTPEALKQILMTPPDWTQGLPIQVKVESGTRYGK